MADHNHPVEVSPEELAEAQSFWHGFTQATKYGIISVIIVLVLMALFLL